MHRGKIHIHIQNSEASSPVFIATQEHLEALLAKNEDLADRLHVTLGSSLVDEVDCWTEENLKDYYEQMKTADVLVGYTFPRDNLASYAPQLRFIHFISSGVEHMAPFDWVPQGLKLVNNCGVHLPKSGESFAMFLAMLNAGIPRLATAQRAGIWDKHYTTVIRGKTLVVVGIGHQGGEMCRQAKKLGLRVLGIHPSRTSHPWCDAVLPSDRMEEAFAQADFLSIHAPLTCDTRGLISRQALSWLPATASVINVARGALLDEKALSDFLKEGRLAGAILDVFETEPLPPGHFLWETPNLLVSPHVSSDDSVNYMPLTLDLTLANLRHQQAGRSLINQVDIDREY